MSEAIELDRRSLLDEEVLPIPEGDFQALLEAHIRLRLEKEQLAVRVRKGEERRRAMIHIMDDMNQLNKKLADQRKAMLHILADYEQDRRRLVQQTERL